MNNVYKTCVELLSQRGYDIKEKDEEKISAIKQNGEYIYVFLSDTTKLDVNRIKEYVALMNELDIKHSIIVYGTDITPYAKKVVETSKEIKIELFSGKDLEYNITKHIFVPKHECLSKDDGEEFKKKYGIHFGTILLSDPISKFYGYERGDVIKITRKNENNYVTYRIVR